MTDHWALPREWHWATMGDVARVVGGSTPKTGEPRYWSGAIPWITPEDLSGFTCKHIERGRRSITQAGYDSCSTRMLPTGAVLFTSRAPIGYVAIAANPVCTNQGFKSYVCGPDVEPDYVYWYLRNSTGRARSMASGTTFLELSGRAAGRLPIPVPPLDEQRRVVDAIERQDSRLDTAKAALGRARGNLRRYRTALVNAAVAGGSLGLGLDSSTGAGRPSTDWPWATVGELASEVRYGTSAKCSDDSTGVPVLRMGNIVNGRLSLTSIKYLPKGHVEFPDLLLRNGDVLFNRTNSPELVGKAAVYRGTPSACSFASYLIRVRLDPVVLPDWLVFVLSSSLGRRWVAEVVSQQVGQANVNGTKLKNFRVPVPPLEQQVRLVAEVDRRLSIVDELARQVEENLRRTSSLRAGVLRDAFAGRLV